MSGKKLLTLCIAFAMIFTMLLSVPAFTVNAEELSINTIVAGIHPYGGGDDNVKKEIRLGELSSDTYIEYSVNIPADKFWGGNRDGIECRVYTTGKVGIYVNSVKIVDKNGVLIQEWKGEDKLGVGQGKLGNNCADFTEWKDNARYVKPGADGLFIWGAETFKLKDSAAEKGYKVIASLKMDPNPAEDPIVATLHPWGGGPDITKRHIRFSELSSVNYKEFNVSIPKTGYWEGSNRTGVECRVQTYGKVGLYVNSMRVQDKDKNILKEWKGEAALGMDVDGAALRTNLRDNLEFKDNARYVKPGKSGLFIWGGDVHDIKDTAEAKEYRVYVSIKMDPTPDEIVAWVHPYGGGLDVAKRPVKLSELSSKEYRSFEIAIPANLWNNSPRDSVECRVGTQGSYGIYCNNLKLVDKDGNVIKEWKDENGMGMDYDGVALRCDNALKANLEFKDNARYVKPGTSGLFIWGGEVGNLKASAAEKGYKVIASLKIDPYPGEEEPTHEPTEEPTQAPTDEPTEEPTNPKTDVPATSDVSVIMSLVIAGVAAFGGLKLRKK